LAGIMGKGFEALEHLKKVRNFTSAQAIEHKKQAFQLWRERNELMWKLDISLITNNNIKLSKSLPTKEERVIIAKESLSKEVINKKKSKSCKKIIKLKKVKFVFK